MPIYRYLGISSAAQNLILSRCLHRFVAINGDNKDGTLTQLQIETISARELCIVLYKMRLIYNIFSSDVSIDANDSIFFGKRMI